jgi:hypothetical protein
MTLEQLEAQDGIIANQQNWLVRLNGQMCRCNGAKPVSVFDDRIVEDSEADAEGDEDRLSYIEPEVAQEESVEDVDTDNSFESATSSPKPKDGVLVPCTPEVPSRCEICDSPEPRLRPAVWTDDEEDAIVPDSDQVHVFLVVC